MAYGPNKPHLVNGPLARLREACGLLGLGRESRNGFWLLNIPSIPLENNSGKE